MKRIISAIFLLGALLGVACNKPKEVPDKVLGQIFHDAMLVNAYLNFNTSFKPDSLNIYEPIFASYGYTTEDVQYTINNFSRRKSIRLSDVAEYMIGLLEEESASLRDQVARQDTIDNVARRRFTRTLLSDTTIVVKEAADSSRLRFVIEDPLPGDYTIRGSYTLDSLDKGDGRRLYIYFQRKGGRQQQLLNGMLQRNKGASFKHDCTVEESDSTVSSLVVDLFHFSSFVKKRTVPKITVHNVSITYTPPVEESVRLLFNEQAQMRIFSDSLINIIESQARK